MARFWAVGWLRAFQVYADVERMTGFSLVGRSARCWRRLCLARARIREYTPAPPEVL